MTKNLSSFFKSTSSVAAIFVLTASVFFHPSQATEYKSVVSEKSTIGFSYKQMGVGSDGQFKKFTAQISFDPAKPQAAKASFDIDLIKAMMRFKEKVGLTSKHFQKLPLWPLKSNQQIQISLKSPEI